MNVHLNSLKLSVNFLNSSTAATHSEKRMTFLDKNLPTVQFLTDMNDFFFKYALLPKLAVFYSLAKKSPKNSPKWHNQSIEQSNKIHK